MDVRDAVCLVTGASGGIGRATARRLGRAGARVIATGRDEPALLEVTREIDGRPLVADLSEAGAGARLATEAEAVFGRVDVLINNAAMGWAGAVAEMPDELVERIVTVNLLAPIRLTRALLPGMLERGGGHVVNVTSIVGHVGVADEAVYAATKGGLIAFTDSLRYEHGDRVGVSLVTPGVVDTAFFEHRGKPYGRRRPRPIDPDRVAAAVVRAITRKKHHVVVPGWLRFPIWLHGAAPGLYRALARRFG